MAMGKSEGMCVCGMHTCGKCSAMVLIFGILFLIAGLGLFTASWFNGWFLVGLFLALWGILAYMKM